MTARRALGSIDESPTIPNLEMVHSALLREEFFGLLDQVCVWAGLQQLNGFNPIGSQEVAAHGVSRLLRLSSQGANNLATASVGLLLEVCHLLP